MRYLSELDEQTYSSERIERKYFLNRLSAQKAYSILIKANFRVQYPNRQICSLYYDTSEFTALRDNIDGNPNRSKFRLRYYDNDINRSFIEIKHKRGVIGYKQNFQIQDKFESLDELREFGSKWQKEHIIENLQPTALVKYNRQYFQNKNFRATLDLDVTGFRIIGNRYVTSKISSYSVAEFKFSPASDDEFRAYHPYFASFSLRNTKCSKYANALIHG